MKTHEHLFPTNCIHAGQHPESVTGAVMMPVFQTSTYAQTSPAIHKGYEYSRTHNPTRTALQDNLAALEHAQFCFCFAIRVPCHEHNEKDYVTALQVLGSVEVLI